jgi:hypothetical protein
MGRAIMYAIILSLAAFVLAVTFLFQHGGSERSAAVADITTVHDLRLQPALYKDRNVTTEGIIGFNSQTGQFTLVDGEDQSLVITGYDRDELSILEGVAVRISGRFGFGPDTGIFIDAEIVRRLE